LTAQLATSATNGVLTLNANGSFTYTPNAGFSGSDSFTYRANDGQGLSNVATVTLTVNALNTAPVATNDSYTTISGMALTVPATTGVLANDEDANDNPLTALVLSTTSNGMLVLSANGSFTYTPNAGFTGADSFTYRANDGQTQSNIATVTLTVTQAVNANKPTAAADSYSVNEDVTLTVDAANGVLKNDSDPNQDVIVPDVEASPQYGTLEMNTDGSFTYTPDENHHGTDTFTYQVSDGQNFSDVTTVTITVNPLNDPPVAVADMYTTPAGSVLEVLAATGVLANDSDPDGDTLIAGVTNQPIYGTVLMGATGTFQYTPNPGYSGPDVFSYRVNDGESETTAQVTISVTPAPVPALSATAVDRVFSEENLNLEENAHLVLED
jgi:VCBS repeat-containing protein